MDKTKLDAVVDAASRLDASSRDLTFLAPFREAHEAMQKEPTNWQWIGPHMSQRMFGITEARAKAYAARHGGAASIMAK